MDFLVKSGLIILFIYFIYKLSTSVINRNSMDNNLKESIPNKPINFLIASIVPKGWGKEVQIINKNEYAGKLLIYPKSGATSSMLFHFNKNKSFYILSGEFVLSYYDLDNATLLNKVIKQGDIVEIPKGNPHQLVCLQSGTIIEFSTADYPFDNYRIGQGDSQRI